MTIKAGTIISFAGGCWDDKWVERPHRAKVDFDRAEVTDAFYAKFRSAPPPDGADYGLGYFEFLEYMIAGGFIEEVESKMHWYVGDYDAHEFNPY